MYLPNPRAKRVEFRSPDPPVIPIWPSRDVIETWLDYKRKREVDAIRLRPHPHEFRLYYNIWRMFRRKPGRQRATKSTDYL